MTISLATTCQKSPLPLCSLSPPSPSLRCLRRLQLLSISPPLSLALVSGVTRARPRSYFSPTPRFPSPSPLSPAPKRGWQLPARLQGARGVVGVADSFIGVVWRGTNVASPQCFLLVSPDLSSYLYFLCVLSHLPPTFSSDGWMGD